MLTVRRLRVGEGQLFRQLRLAALYEAPYAFASTYQSALDRSPESWDEQADGTAQGSERATFIAFADELPVGIAALYRCPADAKAGELLQVWVDPVYRHTEVARNLLDAVFQWARAHGFGSVFATITEGNARALAFYRKHGFEVAGEFPSQGEGILLRKQV
ncbi:MAG: GNAT family N-acetyltransferase [Anaerolineae bacterium]|nr:GNAT family N-acetyltransferase [Anaerolineae bacterium]